MTGFLQLPNEIIQIIFSYLSPDDILLNIQNVNHIFRSLACDNRLWKSHCKTLKYWSPHHDIKTKMDAQLSNVDWKRLYVLRKRRNQEAENLLFKAVVSRNGRLFRLEKISLLGLDVKQFLLDQMNLSFLKHEYALARRFHANVSLASMHRAMGISRWMPYSPHKITGTSEQIVTQWRNYAKRSWAPGDLEEIMTALDMFALTNKSRDMSWTSDMLETITNEFKQENPDFQELSTRRKALRVNVWLRKRRYVGTKAQERAFYYLRCVYLGQALAYDDHMSIPLIQCVIYCCVAARLGFRADCCMYPGQLHVIVRSNEGECLDGQALSRPLLSSSKDDRYLTNMILSPYDQDHECNMQLMESMMAPFASQPGTEGILQPMHPVDVLLRHARNIRTGCEQIRRMPANASQQATILMDGAGYSNCITSAYAALWIQMLFTPRWDQDSQPRAMELINAVRTMHPEDYWVAHRFLPTFTTGSMSQAPIGSHSIATAMTPYLPSEIEQQRNRHKVTPSTRTDSGGPARYRVGQVFEHMRYGSVGIITGWVLRHMPSRVDVMVNGKRAERIESVPVVYYHCLAGNNALPAFIKEEYIKLINDPERIPMELLNQSGKYFKNFNVGCCYFISNIKDEFPDD